jgi:hypothetical protein
MATWFCFGVYVAGSGLLVAASTKQARQESAHISSPLSLSLSRARIDTKFRRWQKTDCRHASAIGLNSDSLARSTGLAMTDGGPLRATRSLWSATGPMSQRGHRNGPYGPCCCGRRHCLTLIDSRMGPYKLWTHGPRHCLTLIGSRVLRMALRCCACRLNLYPDLTTSATLQGGTTRQWCQRMSDAIGRR